jgi:gluconate 2-dehydrogenase gamma chain
LKSLANVRLNPHVVLNLFQDLSIVGYGLRRLGVSGYRDRGGKMEEMEKMNRKEAIKRTAAIMGFAVSGSLMSAVLKGCVASRSDGWEPAALNQAQFRVVADLAEVILPRTRTPGAKDAKVERFVDSLIADFVSNEEREYLLEKINGLVEEGFSGLSTEGQNQFVAGLVEDEEGGGRTFFLSFKQMVMLGFFTSEVGATKVLSYDEIPGIYFGCEDLRDVGGRTWVL